MDKKMNKIEKLINELCPDGVEFKGLGEVIRLEKGKQLNKELLSNDGAYPAYNGGVSYSGFTDKSNYDENTIIISQGGASAGFVNFVTTKFYANAHCYVILPKIEIVKKRYVYHFLKLNQKKLTNKQHGAGIPALRTSEILDIPIPIPPLIVQKEIVKILDNFTKLEAELEAELEARRKQYEYYREKLLTFDERGGAQWLRLMDIASYSKNRISADKLNMESYVGVDNLLQNRQGKSTSSCVPIKGNLTEYKTGDVLIGNIRPYLKKIWHATDSGGTNGDVLVVRINKKGKENVNSRFLYHLLASDKFFNYNMQFAKGAKMPRGDKSAIMKFKIPIPEVPEQERIVAILDKFDALVNDISIGLPAELDARRKQYEYYREQLLTFKPLEMQNAN